MAEDKKTTRSQPKAEVAAKKAAKKAKKAEAAER